MGCFTVSTGLMAGSIYYEHQHHLSHPETPTASLHNPLRMLSFLSAKGVEYLAHRLLDQAKKEAERTPSYIGAFWKKGAVTALSGAGILSYALYHLVLSQLDSQDSLSEDAKTALNLYLLAIGKTGGDLLYKGFLSVSYASKLLRSQQGPHDVVVV